MIKNQDNLLLFQKKLPSTSNINRDEAKLWLGGADAPIKKMQKTVITSIFSDQLDAPTKQVHLH